MSPYQDALQSLHDLLGELKELHWRRWIAQDILEWQDRHSTKHHLSAYGGMGSLNDLCVDDIWFGPLLDDVRSICYWLARQPNVRPTAESLDVALGSLGVSDLRQSRRLVNCEPLKAG
jgi:hypothetical protein